MSFRSAMTFIPAVCGWLAMPTFAEAQPPPADYTITVKRGQVAVLRRMVTYDATCSPTAAIPLWVWGSPKLGSTTVNQRDNVPAPYGPCAGRPAGISEVLYRAGPSAGSEEIVIMSNEIETDSWAQRKRIRVLVRIQ